MLYPKVFGPTSGFIISKLRTVKSIIIGTIINAIGFLGLFLFHSTEFLISTNLGIIAVGLTNLFAILVRRKRIEMMRKSEVQSKEVPSSLALVQSFVNTNVWTGETRTYERKHRGDLHNQSNQRGIQ